MPLPLAAEGGEGKMLLSYNNDNVMLPENCCSTSWFATVYNKFAGGGGGCCVSLSECPAYLTPAFCMFVFCLFLIFCCSQLGF
jgi:hypothetical protein